MMIQTNHSVAMCTLNRFCEHVGMIVGFVFFFWRGGGGGDNRMYA